MTRPLLILAFLFVMQVCFCQNQPPDKSKHINLPAYLIELQQISGRDSIIHIDSTYGFQITIPKWWHIRETPLNLFGGIFPAVDSIENGAKAKQL